MQAIQKTLLVPGDDEETSGLRKDTCLLGHRDVEVGAIFRRFLCTTVSVGIFRVWRLVGTRYEE